MLWGIYCLNNTVGMAVLSNFFAWRSGSNCTVWSGNPGNNIIDITRFYITVSDKTVSYYTAGSGVEQEQFNENGTRYHWIAIG